MLHFIETPAVSGIGSHVQSSGRTYRAETPCDRKADVASAKTNTAIIDETSMAGHTVDSVEVDEFRYPTDHMDFHGFIVVFR